MARRRQAASALDYSLSHFREQKQDEVLRWVALVLHRDLERYHSGSSGVLSRWSQWVTRHGSGQSTSRTRRS
jgi:hypothetical protein